MRIEKLNENKIKITFNNKDLEENNIDFHSFMSNTIETQTIFLNLLDAAEKEVGFITDDYKVAIEALSLSDGNFILLVTRLDQQLVHSKQKRVHTSRKLNKVISTFSIYKFTGFEDFCAFCTFLNTYAPELILEFESKNSLYSYKDNYFLIINELSLSSNLLLKLSSNILEFAVFIDSPKMFFNNLKEFGNTIIEDNAINMCVSNFKL